MAEEISQEIRGWWRIIDTATWLNERLDILGPALISFTGYDDRLRMHCLLAELAVKRTKTGVSFSWKGAWEFDQLSGTGSAKINKDGMLKGMIKIENGDSSSFTATRYVGTPSPIPDPPSYRDKWRKHW